MTAATSRMSIRLLAVLATFTLLSACAPTPGPHSGDPESAPFPSEVAPVGDSSLDMDDSRVAVFVSVVDGDTIETSAGTVRIIGIDTPERGECGHAEASGAIDGVLAAGDEVTLSLPDGQNDTDQYGRLLRYVTNPSSLDIGMLQLTSGNAIARYDSFDGYPSHPREAEYHEAQRATRASDGRVVTTSCAEQIVPAEPDSTSRWWEQYTSCTKLKKNDTGDPTGPFSREDPSQADIYEWFAYGTGNNGDGDGDGLACE